MQFPRTQLQCNFKSTKEIKHESQKEQKDRGKQSQMEEDEHMRHLSNLQFKLHEELEQLQKYQVNTDMEILQKDKELKRSQVRMDSQRKSILDLQDENEKLSFRLKEEMENNEHLLQRFENNRAMCLALKQKTSSLEQLTEDNENKYKAIYEVDELRNEVIKEIEQKINELKKCHKDKVQEIKKKFDSKANALQEEVNKKAAENVELMQNCEQHEQRAKMHQEEIENLKKEMLGLKEEICKKDKEIQSKSEEIANFRENTNIILNDRDIALEVIQNENKELKECLASNDESFTIKIRELSDQLRNNNEEHENEKNKLQEIYSAALNEITKLQALKENYEEKISNYEKELSEKNNIIEINKNLESQLGSSKILESEMHEKMKAFEKEETINKERMEKLQEELNISNNKLEEQLASHEKKIEEQECEKADIEKIHANEIAQMWNVVNNSHADHQEEINIQKFKFKELQATVDNKEREHQKMKEEWKAMKQAEKDYLQKIVDLKSKLFTFSSPVVSSPVTRPPRTAETPKMSNKINLTTTTPQNMTPKNSQELCYTPRRSVMKFSSGLKKKVNFNDQDETFSFNSSIDSEEVQLVVEKSPSKRVKTSASGQNEQSPREKDNIRQGKETEYKKEKTEKKFFKSNVKRSYTRRNTRNTLLNSKLYLQNKKKGSTTKKMDDSIVPWFEAVC